MAENDRSSGRGNRLRRTARIIGTLLAGFWLFAGIASGIAEAAPWPLPWESMAMAALMIVSAAGVLIAWWREGIGGAVLVTVGVAHCVNALIQAGRNRLLAVLISGVPFIVVGILFLVSWSRSKASE
jgi:hypothetical protein